MEKTPHVRYLAPFASSEDLSEDSRDSPEDGKYKSSLPEIKEESKPTPKVDTLTITPRIDISRASSSSHHDDSSPERELVAGGSKLEVGFTEDMAEDLHSSTEELSFHDQTDDSKPRKKKKCSFGQPGLGDALSDIVTRKDSACSDPGFLNISGRTSRVSSVGSVASGGSGVSNISATSANSHLSATSNLSKSSRGSSPHRMLLETSFCGPKPLTGMSVETDENIKPVVTQRIISRESPKNTSDEPKTKNQRRKPRPKPVIENPKTQKFISLHSDTEDDPVTSNVKNESTTPEEKGKSNLPAINPSTQVFISLHGPDIEDDMTCKPNPNSPKRMKPFTNTTLVNFISQYEGDRRRPKPTVRKSISGRVDEQYEPSGNINEAFQRFISLKDDDDNDEFKRNRKQRASFSSYDERRRRIVVPVQVHCPASPEEKTADYKTGYDDNVIGRNSLSVNMDMPKSKSDECNISSITPADSPELSRYGNKPHRLQLQPSRSVKSMSQLSHIDRDSRTPSPRASTSNNDQFYRRCSESAREINNLGKSKSGSIKSLFSSFFKRGGSDRHKKTRSKNSSRETISHTALEPAITNVEFAFKQSKKEPDSIIIPLHSPDSVTPSEVRYSKRMNEDNKRTKFIVTETELKFPDDMEIEAKLRSVKLEETAPVSKIIINENNIITSTTVTSFGTKDSITRNVYSHAISVQSKEYKEHDDHHDYITSHHNNSDSSNTATDDTVKHVTTEIIMNDDDKIIIMKDEYEKNIVTDDNIQGDAEVPTKVVDDISPSSEQITFEKKIATTTTEGIGNTEIKQVDDGGASTDSDIGVPIIRALTEDENKQLVNLNESFEDDLPFVPTTLPQERSVGVRMTPVKDRLSGVTITNPVERPRSSTPLNPALLETFISSSSCTSSLIHTNESTNTSSDKLHITLPRADCTDESNKLKNLSSKSWQKFAEESINSPKRSMKNQIEKTEGWESFDSQEVQKCPKRITTLPSSSNDNNNQSPIITKNNQKVVFVKPEECSCECHETLDKK